MNRIVTSFENNITFSSKADVRLVSRRDDNTLEIEPFSVEIAEHAFDRMQLFYYQALAYYKTGAVIEIDRTKLQHGSARIPGMQAAHHSLLPSVKDSLGIIANKRFEHTLNATMELPRIVNEFDSAVERELRPFGISLLNECSQGNLLPLEATQLLELELTQFSQESLQSTFRRLDHTKKITHIANKLTPVSKEEDLPKFCKNALKISQLASTLKNEDNRCYNANFDLALKKIKPIKKFLDPYFKSCDDIFEKATTREQAVRALRNLRTLFSQFPESEKNPLSLLKAARNSSVQQLQAQAEQFLSQVNAFELILSSDHLKKSLMDLSIQFGKEDLEKLTAKAHKQNQKLEDGLVAIASEINGMVSPDYLLVSGVVEGTQLRGMFERELQQQQKYLHTVK